MKQRRHLIKYEFMGIVMLGLSLVLGTRDTMAVSSVAISVPATLDLEITPSNDGSSDVKTSNLTISTKNTAGFRVILNSDSTALTNSHHSEQINSITTNTKFGDLPMNTWGVYLGATNPNSSSDFMPIKTTPTEVIRNELADASGTYKLAIGVKADTSLPAGMYQNKLVISVVADASVISLDTATYMQDITPEICANSKVWASNADSTTLIDKRDNKTYKVARLKDGNCWMQENLELELSTNRALTPSDSDVSKNWIPEISTRTAPGDPNVNHMSSWSLGNGQRWYYQWNAATAGSGKNISNGAATDSICPKGWKLPLGGNNNNSINGSFYYLLDKYNATSPSSMNIALAAPLLFVREGYAALNGVNNNITDFAAYWSRTSVSSTNAYAFYFQGNLYPSYDFARSYGFSVRCMVLASGS